MQHIPLSQKRILEFLLENPNGASAEEIAQAGRITKTAVREPLVKLLNLGYLRFEDKRVGVGRPRRLYFLSAQGQEAFPKQYSWLSNVLLEFLAEDLGSAGVSQVMKGLARKVARSVEPRLAKKQSTVERLKEITTIMNELGYHARLTQSDLRKGAVLEATNCVYHSVAKEHPDLCQFDVQFLRNSSGLDVKLESCIARGADICRFCLRRG